MKKLFRLIVIALNVFAAISLLFSCLCCFVNPKTIWWIGFFGLAYIPLLVANFCFVVFWALSRKKMFALLSASVILFGWTFVGRNIQLFDKEIPEEKMEGSIKVMSFNVEGFSQRDTKQPDGEMLNIFDFLREEDADILCLQEFRVYRLIEERTIIKRLENTPFRHIELTNNQQIGVATFSKYPIIRKELIFSDKTCNACIFSDLVIGSDTVRVFNVHLKSVGFQHEEKTWLKNVVKKDYDKSDFRVVISIIKHLRASSFARAKQVEILTSHITQSPYPVIVCGDLNDPPTSYSYQKVRGKMKDAFIEAGSGRSVTFNIGRIASLRIDVILHSDFFKAYNYKSPRVHLSDHFPVMCRLEIVSF